LLALPEVPAPVIGQIFSSWLDRFYIVLNGVPDRQYWVYRTPQDNGGFGRGLPATLRSTSRPAPKMITRAGHKDPIRQYLARHAPGTVLVSGRIAVLPKRQVMSAFQLPARRLVLPGPWPLMSGP